MPNAKCYMLYLLIYTISMAVVPVCDRGRTLTAMLRLRVLKARQALPSGDQYTQTPFGAGPNRMRMLLPCEAEVRDIST